MKNYRINLLPEELQPGLHLKWRNLMPLLIACGITGALLSGYIFTKMASANLEEELASLEAAINNTKPAANQVEQWQKETATLKSWTNQINKTRAERLTLYQILRDINSCVPLDLQLTAITTGASQTSTSNTVQETDGESAEKTTNQQPTPLQPQNTAPDTTRTGDARVGEALDKTASADHTSDTEPKANKPVSDHPPRPTSITMQGITPGLSEVGVLIYNLQQLPHFKQIQLREISRNQTGQLTFTILAVLQEK